MTKLAPVLVLVLAASPIPTAAAPRAPARTPPAAEARGVDAPTRSAPTIPAGAVAFLGLRPTESAAFGATAIAQLAEAQRLRAIAETVVGLLSGAPVLRHDDLRVLLGPTYLAELFECRGDVACQLRVAAPLRARGVAAAVSGDAFAEGEAIRIRLRRLDLAKGRLLEETTFSIPRAAAETLPPWREALQPVFQDTGSLRIVTNVPDPICALDGRPCELNAAGVIEAVPEGEHVVEISKEGYRRGVRVVAVRRGEEQRVALPLEELPVQVQRAPDPAPRLPVFEAPGETTRIAPFGFLRLIIGYDDANAGDKEDLLAPPRRGVPDAELVDEGHLWVLPRPAVFGVSLQAPRHESGWQLRGAFSMAFVKDTTPEIDSSYAELIKDDLGFRVMFGFGAPIFSGLTSGSLTISEGFGDLQAGLIGVTLSKSFGELVLELFGGRHKSQFTPVAVPGGASPGPFAAARIAWVEEDRVGRLYGEEYPLTVAVSGVVGEERVGFEGEAEFLGTVAPVREQALIWAGSLELHVPFGKRASFAGEAWIGENVHLFEGAAWQPPRVSPVTGEHTGLRSAGGWAQLSLNVGRVELKVLGGTDRVLSGLDEGIAPDGAPAVRENRFAAVNAVWYLIEFFSLGAQLHTIRTFYEDPAIGRSTLIGGVFTSQLKF